MANRDIYIFDEVTSNIDVESENLIIENIYKLAKEKMVIMISHRLANVVGSDHIIVMDEGRVVQQGKHEDLCHVEGCYQRMWNVQKALEDGEDYEG